MFEFTPPALHCDGVQANRSASEVERFRARHRRLCRNQPQSAALSLSPKVDALDEDEGRKRKISANWRQKQRQDRLYSQFEDGYWPRSAGTEMHLGFNAFDFSSSPEAFYDEPVEEKEPTSLYELEGQPHCKVSKEELPVESSSDEDKQLKQDMTEVAKQVTAMGFNGISMWQRRFPGLGQLGGPVQQLPIYGQQGAPVHYATINDQRRALYYQPMFFM